ncbi:lipopolysaccharide assembly protein LapB [uncultured Maritimibacter sp.]|jgi:tetratricopeptide (TPR) repeat protein|uniref:tetratricopeptide repeat protein n=1 Tax=uncultured Maritimibacter sp. TaxID=991866 RepID=UPI0026043F70|nr:tetratricopeptide repeat protein [uncultured Maritimibacter sp.]
MTRNWSLILAVVSFVFGLTSYLLVWVPQATGPWMVLQSLLDGIFYTFKLFASVAPIQIRPEGPNGTLSAALLNVARFTAPAALLWAFFARFSEIWQPGYVAWKLRQLRHFDLLYGAGEVAERFHERNRRDGIWTVQVQPHRPGQTAQPRDYDRSEAVIRLSEVDFEDLTARRALAPRALLLVDADDGLGEMAERWSRSARLGAQPLRGRDLEDAERWLVEQPASAPRPTELQRRYILESRRTSNRRARYVAAGSVAGLVVVGALGGFAWVQRGAALEAQAQAERALRTAVSVADSMSYGIVESFQDYALPLSVREAILGEVETLQTALAEGFEGDDVLKGSTAVRLTMQGDVRRSQGDMEAAQSAYAEALAITTSLLESDPANETFRRDQALALDRLANMAEARGDLPEARDYYDQSLEVWRKLYSFAPSDTRWRRGMSAALVRLGALQQRTGDLPAARATYEETVALSRASVGLNASGTDTRRDLALSLGLYGDLLRETGDMDGAQAAYQENFDINGALTQADPANTELQRGLLVSLDQLGGIAEAKGDLAAARAAYTESLTINRRLLQSDPANIDWQRDLALSLGRLGDVNRTLGDLAAAQTAYEESLSIVRALAAQEPDTVQRQRDLSNWLGRLGEVRRSSGDVEGALAAFAEALRIDQALAMRDPQNVEWQRDHAGSLESLADVL